jgi:hypothetical protein
MPLSSRSPSRLTTGPWPSSQRLRTSVAAPSTSSPVPAECPAKGFSNAADAPRTDSSSRYFWRWSAILCLSAASVFAESFSPARNWIRFTSGSDRQASRYRARRSVIDARALSSVADGIPRWKAASSPVLPGISRAGPDNGIRTSGAVMKQQISSLLSTAFAFTGSPVPLRMIRLNSPWRRNAIRDGSAHWISRTGHARGSRSSTWASSARRGDAPHVASLRTETRRSRTSGEGIIRPCSYLLMACLVTNPPSLPARSSMLRPAIFRAALKRTPKGVSGAFRPVSAVIVFLYE